MRKGFALLAIMLMVAAGGALAVNPGPLDCSQETFGDRGNDLPIPQSNGGRADTVWFGGLSEFGGVAVEDGVWDYDTDLYGDPLHGWTSIDLTVDPFGVHWERTELDDFAGDPYEPMLAPVPPATENVGQLWFGLHQDEANLKDFIGGMGYGNFHCNRSFSPALAYAGEAVNIEFNYFQHSEPGFDYTWVYVQCLDDGTVIEDHVVDFLEGISPGGDSLGTYNWLVPQTYGATIAVGELPAETDQIKLEVRFFSDGGWSDEDGDWLTPAGPVAIDNVEVSVGGSTVGEYDFEVDLEGWTFDICEGNGTYIGVVPEVVFTGWIEASGLQCGCALQGNALEFVDEENSPYDPPGHPVLQEEQGRSNIVYRDSLLYSPPGTNVTLVQYDAFMYLAYGAGSFYRPGYMFYPYTTDVNPIPHWSGRLGQDTHWYTGDDPVCSRRLLNFSTLGGLAGDPCPQMWDSLRILYKTVTDCDGFQVPPDQCLAFPFEGQTFGTPLCDNWQLGLTGAADAPAIAFEFTGGQYHDGFGQLFTSYLDPGDLGNSNVTRDLGDHQGPNNDWHRDTTGVSGPAVPPGSPELRFFVELNIRVPRVGARQYMHPAYHAWKARFDEDVEGEDFVAVLLDSAEIFAGGHWMGWPNKFETYFHELDPGFDPNYEDKTPQQEILPDGVFSPGTRVEYFYTSFWYDNWPNPAPEQIFRYPNLGFWEMEILPNMQLNEATPDEYDVLWPSVIYVDAFNRGVEYYVDPLLQQEGIQYDKFDYLDCSSNWHCAFARTQGGTVYNPGGWGNNGLTLDQLLGYRLILFNTGSFGTGCADPLDMDMFEAWLDDISLGTDFRKAIIFDGDQVGSVLEERGLLFFNNVLGAAVAEGGESYRIYNNDWTPCVELVEAAGGEFSVADPGVRLYGSGCPQTYNFNVLENTGVAGTTGNLDFYNYTGNSAALNDYVSYAQVVREKIVPQVANWKSIVNGFSLHHLSEIGCVPGEDCSNDSSCVVSGAADVLGPTLTWVLDGGADPFDPWLYPYTNVGVEEEGETHLSGEVNHLYMSRPNPFSERATIRFSLASAGQVELDIYDVSGRLVKNLARGVMEAGENTVVWDGTNDNGNRVGGGIFWMQMSTHDGYTSCKKMLALR